MPENSSFFRGHMEFAEAFGLVTQARRQRMGLSQSDLASKMGVHRNLISMLERGELASVQDYADKVACALGCRTAQMLSATQRVIEGFEQDQDT